jgi:hypothetical protein
MLRQARKAGVALAGLLIGIAGCQSTPKVNVETDSAVALAKLRTFQLMPLPDRIPGGDPGLMLRLRSTIEQTVKANLVSKGYELKESGAADFAVFVRGEIAPKVQVTDWGYVPGPYVGYRRYGYGYGYGGGYRDLDVDTYEEGLLAVEVYDNASKRLAWVGWSKGRIQRKPIDPERVAAGLNEILARFPTPQT